MLVSGNIPSLINGVSQQPQTLRQTTQLALQENCYPSVVEGLKQRPPVQHIAKVFNGTIGDAFTHLINRDVSNRFEVIITSGLIKVYDLLTGASKTINALAADATAYITDATPSTTFRALTIADYTFILNTTTVVAEDAAVPSPRLSEALIFVAQGEYGSKYEVFIAGSSIGSYTTSTTSVADLDTQTIAAGLVADIGSLSGYTITQVGSTIWIKKTTGSFVATVSDAQGGNSLKCFQTSTQRFSNLPATAPDGYILAIDADPTTNGGVYYVKFTVTGGGPFGQGSWAECADPTLTYIIDPETMPYALVHEANDTFTLQQLTWGQRLCGDDDSNPMPSFVGSTLNDIFLYKNRLSFLSGENFEMSETGEDFNFFRTTVVQLLDSDPIDSRVVNTKVSILRHAIPFNSHCVFFSDQTQFRMNGQNAITPKSVQVDPQTEYESNLLAKPVGVGQSMFFGINKGQFNGIRELYIDEQTLSMDADDVTAHVPAYIPAGLFKMSVSTVESLLACLTTGDRSSIYMYKYLYSQDGAYNSKKMQAAWFKQTMGSPSTVLGADFIETKLYTLTQRTGGVYLEVTDFTPEIMDANQSFVTSLDRRITDEDLISATYDADTNLTTMTFPYTIDGTVQVITRKVASEIEGIALQVTSTVGATITVKGDQSATPCYLGQTYVKQAQLSNIYIRQQSPGGGLVVDPSGRLQLLRAYLLYDTTGYFKVNVTPEGRDTSSYIFTGKVVGDSQSVIGAVALHSGRFKFGIFARNEKVTITLYSDSFLPFRFTGLEWEGQYVKRSRGM